MILTIARIGMNHEGDLIVDTMQLSVDTVALEPEPPLFFGKLGVFALGPDGEEFLTGLTGDDPEKLTAEAAELVTMFEPLEPLNLAPFRFVVKPLAESDYARLHSILKPPCEMR